MEINLFMLTYRVLGAEQRDQKLINTQNYVFL